MKAPFKRIYTFIACLFFAITGYTQTAIPYTAYNAKSGLQTNTVYGLLQDSKGFLWIGSDRGLLRYDGFEFKQYTSPEMAGSSVTKPQEDAYGRIWCMNFYNQVFYIDNDTLKLLEGKPNYTSGFFELNDKKDKLFLVQKEGSPLELDVKTFNAKKINTPVGFNARLCYFFNNSLFMIDNTGVIIRCDNGKLTIINSAEITKVGNSTYYLIPVPVNGKLCLFETSQQKLFCIANDSLTDATYLLKNFDFRQWTNAKTYAPGKSFFATNSGYYLFDKSDSISGPYFSQYRVSTIIEDSEGQQWIGTLDNGLIKIPNPLLSQCYKPNTAENNIVCYTLGSANTLWVGYSNGLVQELQLPGCTLLNEYELPEKRDINQLVYEPVKNRMFAFQNGTYELKSGKYVILGMSLTKSAVVDGQKDLLYSASSNGISQLNISADKAFKEFDTAFQIKGSKLLTMLEKGRETHSIEVIADSRGRCIVYDSTSGYFYAGHSKGLSYFNISQAPLEITDKGKPIYATRLLNYQGKTWVATISSGIYILQNNKIVQHLTVANGLNGNTLETLIPFGQEVWAAGVGFINRININSFVIAAINGSTGLLANKAVGIIPLNNNEFLFVNSGGIFKVGKNSLIRTMPSPKLYLTQAYVNEKPFDINAGNNLKFNQNNLRFDFTAVQLSDPEGLVFYYQLNLDKWIALPHGQRNLSLTALADGDYELKMKAVNRSGQQSNILTVPFTIYPPFWRATWFLALLVFVLLVAVALLYHYNINRINKRNRLLQEKAKLEADVRASQLSALKVQMNPHFIFNALNSIQEFILTNEKKLANQYLGKFSDLMRITLDLSQEDLVPLNEELKALTLYLELENLRFSNEIDCTLDTGNIEFPDRILIPPMLIQPFVENAIKHGLLHKKGYKKLTVYFSVEPHNSLLYCVIEDNGIGRKKSEDLKKFRPQKHKSFATSATTQRLQLLNTGTKSKIRVEYTDIQTPTGEVIGTSVELYIPYVSA